MMLNLQVQSILYEHKQSVIHRFLTSLLINTKPQHYNVTVQLGDCSAQSLLSAEQLADWQARFAAKGYQLTYTFFQANLGPTKGHNRLFFGSKIQPDRVLFLNPDAVVPFHLLERLNRLADTRADWGAIEGRQIPFEHPKKFDQATLETLSLTTACALCHGPTFAAIGGFDELFFMYGDDVDLGWRLMAQGRKLYYAIDTFIYHTKQVDKQGMIPSEAEKFYMPLTNLILWVKYGRTEFYEQAWNQFKANASDPYYARAMQEFETVRSQIVPATAQEKAAATFDVDGFCHLHRWWY